MPAKPRGVDASAEPVRGPAQVVILPVVQLIRHPDAPAALAAGERREPL
ncbi:hypothetical protein MWN33_13500 [Starkeya koreensis]|uniref:Uncharacterized protein n=1 Tax=Ancylobacter koreensis TaxID=266121 RepID=A0ABT0DP36_9HYPH|nr:hypothetical protein [Ancylobacter koreensis]MCK0209047.1 hypothetical protein [Ancylobacter koreensis]